METNKYKLSQELKDVMDLAFDHAKDNNLGEISLVSVEYYIKIFHIDMNTIWVWLLTGE